MSPHSTGLSRNKILITMLAKPSLKLPRNLYLILHRILPGKSYIPISQSRITTENLFSTFKEINNTFLCLILEHLLLFREKSLVFHNILRNSQNYINLLQFLRNMGLFSRLFKKKQETIKEITTLDQLPDWYETKILPKKQELKEKIAQAKQNIIKKTQETKQKLEALKNTELQNPNIPERAKHFMQGNRDSYTKKINAFLDELIMPEEINELNGFFTDYNTKLHNLAKSIARPTQILNEFLSNETRAVTIPLGMIEKEIQKLKDEMQKAYLHIIGETKTKIQEAQNKKEKESELKKQVNNLTKEINQIQKENKILTEEIEILNKDKELEEERQEANQIQQNIKKIRQEVIESFSIIETAMKKYERITYQYQHLITKYLESPINALMEDMRLEVVSMLNDMKKKLESNHVELKDKKRKKTIEEIDKMTKDWLGQFLTDYGQLHKIKKEIHERMKKMDVVVVVSEKEKKKQKNNNKLAELKNQLNYFQTELNRTHVDELIKELETELGKQMNLELTISLKPLVQAIPYPEQKQ
jgi:hypothetical protein